MGLNIKNERVHDLAREAARVTGKTQTGAIEEALERLLTAYGADPGEADRRRRLDVIHRIAVAWEPAPDGGDHVVEVEDLYDATTGLPA